MSQLVHDIGTFRAPHQELSTYIVRLRNNVVKQQNRQ